MSDSVLQPEGMQAPRFLLLSFCLCKFLQCLLCLPPPCCLLTSFFLDAFQNSCSVSPVFGDPWAFLPETMLLSICSQQESASDVGGVWLLQGTGPGPNASLSLLWSGTSWRSSLVPGWGGIVHTGSSLRWRQLFLWLSFCPSPC